MSSAFEGSERRSTAGCTGRKRDRAGHGLAARAARRLSADVGRRPGRAFVVQHRAWRDASRVSRDGGRGRGRARLYRRPAGHRGQPPLPLTMERPGRLRLWRAAAAMFAAHPLLGVGPDNFRLLHGGFAGLSNPDPRMHSNNMYLEILVGSGLLGAVAFGWLVWSHRGAACVSRARGGRIDRSSRTSAWFSPSWPLIALHGTVDSFLSASHPRTS